MYCLIRSSYPTFLPDQDHQDSEQVKNQSAFKTVYICRPIQENRQKGKHQNRKVFTCSQKATVSLGSKFQSFGAIIQFQLEEIESLILTDPAGKSVPQPYIDKPKLCNWPILWKLSKCSLLLCIIYSAFNEFGFFQEMCRDLTPLRDMGQQSLCFACRMSKVQSPASLKLKCSGSRLWRATFSKSKQYSIVQVLTDQSSDSV